MSEALAPRSVGDTKPLRWFCGRRNSTDASIVSPIDLTGATVLAYIRKDGSGSNLAAWDGKDVSASITAPAAAGNIDHTPVGAEITELVQGEYTWNLKITEGSGQITFVPADEVGGIKVEVGTLSVFSNLAS